MNTAPNRARSGTTGSAAASPGAGSQAVAERVTALLEPVLAAAAYELVAVEAESLGSPAAVLRILLERDGSHLLGPGIDLDGVAEATRLVESVLDGEPEVVPGRYSLEVSSPGLERPLRTPAHFQRAVGRTVSLRTHPGTPGDRRVEGVIEAADDSPDGGVTIAVGGSAPRVVAYAAIERARTVFVWGPAPRPGAAGARGSRPTPGRPARPGPGPSRVALSPVALPTARAETPPTGPPGSPEPSSSLPPVTPGAPR